MPDGQETFDGSGHGARKPSGRIVLVLFIVTFVLVGGGTGLTQASPQLGLWSLVLGSVMLALAAASAVAGVSEALGRWWAKKPAWLGKALGFVAAVCAVGVLSYILVPPLYGAYHRNRFGCDPAVEFTVVTSEDDRATAQELVNAYEADDAVQNHGCATVSGYVYTTTASALSAGVAQNWAPIEDNPQAFNPVRDVGTRPDIWLTTSSLATSRLAQKAPPGLLVDPGPIATSPIVLAVPGHATQIGSAGMSWRELLSSAPLPSVVRADPHQSLEAALATAGMYGVEVDRAGRAPFDDAGTSEQSHQADEALFARSAAATSYPPATESDLLCRDHQSDSPAAAAVMSEQDMIRFNLGLAVDQCPSASGPPGPDRVLHAFYPATPGMDERSVLLHWPSGASSPAAEAAADFDHWLRSGASHAALHCAGLRPIGGAPDDPACPWTGVLDQASSPTADVAAAIVDGTVLPEQQAAAPRRQSEFLVDTSGSMSTPDRPAATRLAAVAQAIGPALAELRPEDLVGLRLFPGDAAASGSREAVPAGAMAELLGGVPRSAGIMSALSGATTSGNTPLYASIVQSVKALQITGAGQVDNLILVTDGDDTSSTIQTADVLTALRGSGVRLRVAIVGTDVTCAAPLFRDLEPNALGTCDDESSGTPVAAALNRIVAN